MALKNQHFFLSNCGYCFIIVFYFSWYLLVNCFILLFQGDLPCLEDLVFIGKRCCHEFINISTLNLELHLVMNFNGRVDYITEYLTN